MKRVRVKRVIGTSRFIYVVGVNVMGFVDQHDRLGVEVRRRLGTEDVQL